MEDTQQQFKHQFEALLQDNPELNEAIALAQTTLSPDELSELAAWAAAQLQSKLLGSQAVLLPSSKPHYRDKYRDDEW